MLVGVPGPAYAENVLGGCIHDVPSRNTSPASYRCGLLFFHSKNSAGGKEEAFSQPPVRFYYNKYMGGVDLSDQLNGYYLSLHKARAYVWTRVFEQKLLQACTNAWLLYVWWAVDMKGKVSDEIKALE